MHPHSPSWESWHGLSTSRGRKRGAEQSPAVLHILLRASGAFGQLCLVSLLACTLSPPGWLLRHLPYKAPEQRCVGAPGCGGVWRGQAVLGTGAVHKGGAEQAGAFQSVTWQERLEQVLTSPVQTTLGEKELEMSTLIHCPWNFINTWFTEFIVLWCTVAQVPWDFQVPISSYPDSSWFLCFPLFSCLQQLLALLFFLPHI